MACDQTPCPNRHHQPQRPNPSAFDESFVPVPDSPLVESPVTQSPRPETPTEELEVAALIARTPSPISIPTRPPSAPPVMGTQGQQVPPVAQAAAAPQQAQAQAPAAQAAAQPDPMQMLLQSMALLNQSMSSLVRVTTNANSSKVVQKPAAFTGVQGGEARRFLAAFTMWAMSQGASLNVLDPNGDPLQARDDQWIRTVLSYMQDDAALWATPAMEELTQGTTPFNGSWNDFRQQFKARFETVDEAVDAKERLRKLWQGSSTLPEYAARFNELAGRTGYSAQDLRDRFYEHLSDVIKDELVHTARPIASLDELIKVASDIDVRVRQRRAEKARQQGRTITFPTPKSTVAPHTTPFTPPARDPNAMEIDATRTRDEFNRLMRGKCYGCGSTEHVKKDGKHDREICNYCRRAGHREVVCMDKFLKKTPTRKVAATIEEPVEMQTVASTASSPTPSDSSTLLAQLMEQQKALAEQITLLQQSF